MNYYELIQKLVAHHKRQPITRFNACESIAQGRERRRQRVAARRGRAWVYA